MKYLLLVIFYLNICVAHGNPLPAAEVFEVGVKKIDPNTFIINWHIKPHYFLYSNRIKLIPEDNSIVHLGPLRLPTALIQLDKQGTQHAVYRNELSIPVSILAEKPGETLLNLQYQGCADDGFCYPPETKLIKLAINAKLSLTQVNLEQPEKRIGSTITQSKSLKDINQIFTDHNWLVTLVIFFGLGLLLSFTPCILPMVPVLSGIIVGHGSTITARKAFLLSLSYVLSMSFTYALLGAIVALLGANLQISMQSPFAITLFSLIFILLALSMFGFYEFKLPDSWQKKLSGTSQSKRGGHYIGAAIMGCLSTLILSPCVTAPLIGVLTYIAQTGNVLYGMLTLFVLSLGMGTPLLLIGTSAGKWLPETGSWMNAVKAFFGILLISTAIYLMSRILPPYITMVLWAILLIFSGIYTRALQPSRTNKEKFAQGIGIILLCYGILILIGASMGAVDPLQPLASQQDTRESFFSEPQQIQTLESVQKAISKAKGKPVMLDFYAQWCTSCKIIAATTLKETQVKDLLSHFKVIKIDITANNEEDKKIMNYFNVIAPPTFIFFNSKNQQLPDLQLVGEISTPEFLKTLSKVLPTE